MGYAKKKKTKKGKVDGISFVTQETERCQRARPLIDAPPISTRQASFFFPSRVKPAEPVKAACDLLLWKQLCQIPVSLHPEKRRRVPPQRSWTLRRPRSTERNHKTQIKNLFMKMDEKWQKCIFLIQTFMLLHSQKLQKTTLNIGQLSSNLAGVL